MKFLAAQWLWGLLLLPVLFGFLFWDEKKRKALFARFAEPKLWPLISPEMSPNQRRTKALLLLAALGFVFIALARPQLGTHSETLQVAGLDVMVVLDVSNSMEVEDVAPNRLKKAKHIIRSLGEKLGGDRLGLIAFANSSYVACPLTTDIPYVLDTLQILGPKSIQSQGTDIGSALETALKAMDRGAQEDNSPPPSAGGIPSKVIVLISDGEDHGAEAKEAAAKIKESGVRLYVLGIGTEKGAPIPVRDDQGNAVGFKRDRSGQVVVSSFRPQALTEVAEKAQGKYWAVTPQEEEVDELLKEIGALDRTSFAERQYIVYEEQYQIPLLIAIILLFIGLSISARRRQGKSETALKAGIPLTIVFLTFSEGTVLAQDLGSRVRPTAPLDAYLENQKGIEAYKEGKIEEAQKNFGAAQARDPSRPELEFNQGVVQLQQGQVDRAIESFGNSAKAAGEKRDSSLLGKSLYNRGNAYAKKGDVEGAVRSYLGAIQAASEAKNPKLEEESRKNLQLLLNEMKKQQEQKDQKEKSEQNSKSESKQDKEQKDQKEQDKEQKSGSPKESESQKSEKNETEESKENPRYQQHKPDKGKFESKKMSPEDAERVMSELTTKERTLREKLQKQNARQQDNVKDW